MAGASQWSRSTVCNCFQYDRLITSRSPVLEPSGPQHRHHHPAKVRNGSRETERKKVGWDSTCMRSVPALQRIRCDLRNRAYSEL